MDYDYFSGLATKGHESEVEELTTESTEDTEVAAGQRLAGQAGAEFSNPFTIELAQDSENTLPTRTANGPAEEAIRAEMQRSGNIEPRSTRIYTTKHRGRCAVDCRKAARRVRRVGTSESNKAEAQDCAWQAKLALLFQIPLQASLHGIVKLHRSLASRAALLGNGAAEDLGMRTDYVE